MKFWLMKTEPVVFSINDLKTRNRDSWEGVRNYQVRNFMRDEMQPGDRAIIYHSGKKPEAAGTAVVVTTGYPDHTSWDPGSRYYDPSSRPEKPVWFMVDVQFESVFNNPVSLKNMRKEPELSDLQILKKGNRLSITRLSEKEFQKIVKMSE